MKLFLSTIVVALLICLSKAASDDDDFEETLASSDFEDEEKDQPVAPPKEKLVYTAPSLKEPVHFSEHFESKSDLRKKWIKSSSKKEGAEDPILKYEGVWEIEEPTTSSLKNDLGLVLKSKAKHHAISAYLKKPFEFVDQPLIAQYEVKFQEGQECGGAYIKLLTKSSSLDLNDFNDKTPYTIMFGPDKCGNDHKLHFIFRHKNPITGEFEEKHAKKPSASLESYFTDKKTHLYTLIVKPDNSYQIYVDQSRIAYGNLLEDFTPSVNPSKEITDPDDKKPDDWDDRERIKDPEASKPEDWDETEPEFIDDVNAVKPEGWLDDEPELIPDPSAEKPSDWDEDMDGEWEAPLIGNKKCESAPGCGQWKLPQIKNPKYKGKWEVPMIDNPNFKGKWSPRMIANPNYFEDKEPFKMSTIDAIGLELWSISNEIVFDNFIITSSQSAVDDWTAQTWSVKHAEESNDSAGSVVQSVLDATQERPWLWAVIVVVIVLPIVLIVAYCCFSSPKSGERVDRKKTDAPSPDDEEEDEEEEEEDDGLNEGAAEEVGEAAGDDQTSGSGSYDAGEKKVKKRTKADLEAKKE